MNHEGENEAENDPLQQQICKVDQAMETFVNSEIKTSLDPLGAEDLKVNNKMMDTVNEIDKGNTPEWLKEPENENGIHAQELQENLPTLREQDIELAARQRIFQENHRLMDEDEDICHYQTHIPYLEDDCALEGHTLMLEEYNDIEDDVLMNPSEQTGRQRTPKSIEQMFDSIIMSMNDTGCANTDTLNDLIDDEEHKDLFVSTCDNCSVNSTEDECEDNSDINEFTLTNTCNHNNIDENDIYDASDNRDHDNDKNNESANPNPSIAPEDNSFENQNKGKIVFNHKMDSVDFSTMNLCEENNVNEERSPSNQLGNNDCQHSLKKRLGVFVDSASSSKIGGCLKRSPYEILHDNSICIAHPVVCETDSADETIGESQLSSNTERAGRSRERTSLRHRDKREISSPLYRAVAGVRDLVKRFRSNSHPRSLSSSRSSSPSRTKDAIHSAMSRGKAFLKRSAKELFNLECFDSDENIKLEEHVEMSQHKRSYYNENEPGLDDWQTFSHKDNRTKKANSDQLIQNQDQLEITTNVDIHCDQSSETNCFERETAPCQERDDNHDHKSNIDYWRPVSSLVGYFEGKDQSDDKHPYCSANMKLHFKNRNNIVNPTYFGPQTNKTPRCDNSDILKTDQINLRGSSVVNKTMTSPKISYIGINRILCGDKVSSGEICFSNELRKDEDNHFTVKNSLPVTEANELLNNEQVNVYKQESSGNLLKTEIKQLGNIEEYSSTKSPSDNTMETAVSSIQIYPFPHGQKEATLNSEMKGERLGESSQKYISTMFHVPQNAKHTYDSNYVFAKRGNPETTRVVTEAHMLIQPYQHKKEDAFRGGSVDSVEGLSEDKNSAPPPNSPKLSKSSVGKNVCTTVSLFETRSALDFSNELECAMSDSAIFTQRSDIKLTSLHLENESVKSQAWHPCENEKQLSIEQLKEIVVESERLEDDEQISLGYVSNDGKQDDKSSKRRECNVNLEQETYERELMKDEYKQAQWINDENNVKDLEESRFCLNETFLPSQRDVKRNEEPSMLNTSFRNNQAYSNVQSDTSNMYAPIETEKKEADYKLSLDRKESPPKTTPNSQKETLTPDNQSFEEIISTCETAEIDCRRFKRSQLFYKFSRIAEEPETNEETGLDFLLPSPPSESPVSLSTHSVDIPLKRCQFFEDLPSSSGESRAIATAVTMPPNLHLQTKMNETVIATGSNTVVETDGIAKYVFDPPAIPNYQLQEVEDKMNDDIVPSIGEANDSVNDDEPEYRRIRWNIESPEEELQSKQEDSVSYEDNSSSANRCNSCSYAKGHNPNCELFISSTSRIDMKPAYNSYCQSPSKCGGHDKEIYNNKNIAKKETRTIQKDVVFDKRYCSMLPVNDIQLDKSMSNSEDEDTVSPKCSLWNKALSLNKKSVHESNDLVKRSSACRLHCKKEPKSASLDKSLGIKTSASIPTAPSSMYHWCELRDTSDIINQHPFKTHKGCPNILEASLGKESGKPNEENLSFDRCTANNDNFNETYSLKSGERNFEQFQNLCNPADSDADGSQTYKECTKNHSTLMRFQEIVFPFKVEDQCLRISNLRRYNSCSLMPPLVKVNADSHDTVATDNVDSRPPEQPEDAEANAEHANRRRYLFRQGSLREETLRRGKGRFNLNSPRNSGLLKTNNGVRLKSTMDESMYTLEQSLYFVERARERIDQCDLLLDKSMNTLQKSSEMSQKCRRHLERVDKLLSPQVVRKDEAVVSKKVERPVKSNNTVQSNDR